MPTGRAALADRSAAVDKRTASIRLMEVAQLTDDQPAIRDGIGYRGVLLFLIAATSAARQCEPGIRHLVERIFSSCFFFIGLN